LLLLAMAFAWIVRMLACDLLASSTTVWDVLGNLPTDRGLPSCR
jgi:hypothetical protein